MRTGEIIFKLRTWAESIRTKHKDRYELLCEAADKLDDLDERVAIMTEYGSGEENNLTFPPENDEIGG